MDASPPLFYTTCLSTIATIDHYLLETFPSAGFCDMISPWLSSYLGEIVVYCSDSRTKSEEAEGTVSPWLISAERDPQRQSLAQKGEK